MPINTDNTIAAIATPPGRGGIGIIRLSGDKAKKIGEQLSGLAFKPRYAHYARFHLEDAFIDEGLVLFFPGPNSFTGEDVVELQGHGGPQVQKMLLDACLSLGARLANPGEFSQRAFLNDRMDLTQAEAIADLIDAGTETAVRTANRSLQGVFSEKINELQEQLTHIRVFIEAAIDFPEEEIDFIGESDILDQINAAQNSLQELLIEARQGQLIREGARIAIIGRPNAGKSSLINQLARQEVAIVTDIAGTTRDTLEASIDLKGIPVTFIDTAGLNQDPDQVEKIGIERTFAKADDADILLFVFDAVTDTGDNLKTILGEYADILDTDKPIIYLANKTDLNSIKTDVKNKSVLAVSAKTGEGIDQLIDQIKTALDLTEQEPSFSARTRHVQSLNACLEQIKEAVTTFNTHKTAELLAEDMRQAQKYLSEITGDFRADDLLGEIFSNFCIGK